ncbi:hypothetical protein NB693_25535 [Pantoea ananatis]|nr:hypothetical protein [Pantoea ananatis]
MSLIQRLNHTLGLTSIIVSHHVHETLASPTASRRGMPQRARSAA